VALLAARPYLGQARFVLDCGARLGGATGLQGALQRYRTHRGEYPERLLDLHPDFVTKRSIFHCPADTSPPESVSYIYSRPKPDAPKSTIVLICDHHLFSATPVLRFRWEVPIEGEPHLEQVRAAVSLPGR
jgi:hypothetical protein